MPPPALLATARAAASSPLRRRLAASAPRRALSLPHASNAPAPALRRSLHASSARLAQQPPGGGGGFNGFRMGGQQAPKPGETLAKYSSDLTALAKEGKLDPVIGR